LKGISSLYPILLFRSNCSSTDQLFIIARFPLLKKKSKNLHYSNVDLSSFFKTLFPLFLDNAMDNKACFIITKGALCYYASFECWRVGNGGILTEFFSLKEQ
jgi:hypothetical protein